MKIEIFNKMRSLILILVSIFLVSGYCQEVRQSSYVAFIKGGYNNGISYQIQLDGKVFTLSFSQQSNLTALSSLLALDEGIAAHFSEFPTKIDGMDSGCMILRGEILNQDDNFATFKLHGWGILGRFKVTERVQKDDPIDVRVIKRSELLATDFQKGERFNSLSKKMQQEALNTVVFEDKKIGLFWVVEKPSIDLAPNPDR